MAHHHHSPEDLPHPLVDDERLLSSRLALVVDNPQGEPLTWGATPTVWSREVAIRQEGVQQSHGELFRFKSIPKHIHVVKSFARRIYDFHLSRTTHRQARNLEGFAFRRDYDISALSLEHLEVLERIGQGFASPGEILVVAEALGIPTIELASLTHPYGHRLELLGPMRAAVEDAIQSLGGEVKDFDDEVEYEIRGSSHPNNLAEAKGIYMTRKRQIGVLPSGFVAYERSSFVINLDQLPEKYASAIRAVEGGEYWASRVRRAERFYEYFPGLLTNDDHNQAIPVSTTIFAVNEMLASELFGEEATSARRKRIVGSAATRRHKF